MAELIFFRRNEELMRLGLDAARLTVGRAESNDVVIPDPSVSRVQFAIEPRPDGAYRFQDLSGRGTDLVGRPQTEALLQDGMDVALGQWRVLFRTTERAPIALAEGEATRLGETAVMSRSGSLGPAPMSPLYLRVDERRDGPRNEACEPRRIPLVDGLTLGTSSDCGLTLDDPFVSALHARFERRSHQVIVRDLASKNGVYIGGVRVWEAEVPLDATLRIGETDLTLVAGAASPGGGYFEGMFGSDPAVRKLFEVIERVAPSQAAVAIFGESGTGKELVAQALHRRSLRAKGPFIPINCGALNSDLIESELFGHEKGAFTGADRLRKGAFEEADGGTLFLDEIGELPLALQAKLLRALELGEIKRVGATRPLTVDIRVVAATNRDLRQEIKRGTFREDLYWRLCTIPIQLPPLRARRGDIKGLIAHFMTLYSPRDQAIQLSSAAEKKLVSHDWPGNIRELRNTLHRTLLLRRANPIEPEDITFERDFSPSAQIRESDAAYDPNVDDLERVYLVGKTLEAIEDEVFLKTCRRVGARATHVARELGQSRGAAYRRMEKLGITPGGEGSGE